MWILGLGGLRGMDLTRCGVYKSSGEQKPAACCVIFTSNVPSPKDYILLRIPKRLRDNLLSTTVYPKKGPDSALVTFIIILFLYDTMDKTNFLKMELT